MNASQVQRFVMRLALAGAQVYAWLGIFTFLSYAQGSVMRGLSSTALLYALGQVITILLTPLVARNIAHGMRHPMMLGVLSAAAAYAALGFGFLFGESAHVVLESATVFTILIGVYRALYFVPYESVQGTVRASLVRELAVALMPTLGGFAILYVHAMPAALYLAAAAILALSMLIIYFIPERAEGFSWGYRETFYELFRDRHVPFLVKSFCDGIEGAALLFLWPILVWFIVGRYVPLVGLVISISMLLTLSARALLRRMHWHPSAGEESLVVMAVWIFRSLAGTLGAVIAIDVYAGSASEQHIRGMDMATLEQAADNHTYVDEFTALKEMGGGLGRLVLALFVGCLASFSTFGITIFGAFLLTGILAGYGVYSARSHQKVAF